MHDEGTHSPNGTHSEASASRVKKKEVKFASADMTHLKHDVGPASPRGGDHSQNTDDWLKTDEEFDMENQGKNDPVREVLAKMFSSLYYDLFLATVLSINLIQIVSETDTTAKQEDDPTITTAMWIYVVGRCLTVIYCIEILMRMYLLKWGFFSNRSNTMDAIIVGGDVLIALVGSAITSFNALRMFRLLRLGRAHKIVSMVPELSLMMKGMVHAARSIFWGVCLVTLILVLWSVAAVQMIHPLNKKLNLEDPTKYEGCERCPRAYESVWSCVVTFTQTLLGGDSWGLTSLQIIEAYPPTFVFFLAVLATVTMGLLNLIMAVIVDASMQSRKESAVELCMSKEKEYKEHADNLMRICGELDEDGSGTLTFMEMMNGYRTHMEFRMAIQSLDLTREDMKMVFSILDTDGSGDVEYKEFVECMLKMKTADGPATAVFMQHHMKDLLLHVRKQLDETHKVQHAVAAVQQEVDVILKEEMIALKNQLAESLLSGMPKPEWSAASGKAPLDSLEASLKASAMAGKEASRGYAQDGPPNGGDRSHTPGRGGLHGSSSTSSPEPSWNASAWDAADAAPMRPNSPLRAPEAKRSPGPSVTTPGERVHDERPGSQRGASPVRIQPSFASS